MELITITIDLLGQLNYLAVLVAALAAFVLGFLWYGPVFGKQWMGYMGFTQEDVKKTPKNKMTVAYVITFVSGFVEAMFLLFFTLLLQTQFWHVAIMIWIGFIVFAETGVATWGGKSWGLFVLNAGHRLVNLLLMGYILSLFF